MSDVRTVFHISKSENRNQVHYGIRLDSECRPRGSHPVFAYWLNLEDNPPSLSRLTDRERPVYGVVPVQRIGANGRRMVTVQLQAMPARPIRFETWRTPDGTCGGRAVLRIAGESARLEEVYAQMERVLGISVGIEYLRVRGRRLSDDHRIEEQLDSLRD